MMNWMDINGWNNAETENDTLPAKPDLISSSPRLLAKV